MGERDPITINIDPANLTATVNQWNADCAAGKGDSVYGRAASTMLPISTPPFYALPQLAVAGRTRRADQSGTPRPRCATAGNPIPRSYSNGECGPGSSGSVKWRKFPSGEIFATAWPLMISAAPGSVLPISSATRP